MAKQAHEDPESLRASLVEEELRRSEQRFRSIFDQAGIAVGFIESQTGRIVRINNKYADLIGYTNEELAGKTWMEITHPDDLKADLDRMDLILDGRISEFTLEKRLIHKDGSIIWINLTVSPIRIPGEALRQHIVVIEDISSRKRFESEARRRRDELVHVQRVAALGEMAASLAHEMNQPLAGIANYCYAGQQIVGRATSGDSEKLKDVFQKLTEQSLRAGQIVKRIRALSSKTPIQYLPIDVNELVRGVVEIFRTELRHHEIFWVLNLETQLPPVLADSVQIQQVLMNLVKNSIDAMSDNEQNDKQLTISTVEIEERYVEVAVSDNGKGIAPGDESRLFDAFYTTKTDGMGMGLAVSRSIIEAHRGRLQVRSNCDRGVTFSFSVPVE